MEIINKTNISILNELLRKVMLKTPNKKENGIFGSIIIEDFDMDRVYMGINGNEYVLRTWNIIEISKNEFRIDWTLFAMIDDGNGGGHGEELSCGTTKINNKTNNNE